MSKKEYLYIEEIKELGFIPRLELNDLERTGYSDENSYVFKKNLSKPMFSHSFEGSNIDSCTLFLIYRGPSIRSLIYFSEPITVENRNKVKNEIIVFNGFIQTKSELEIILKMLGVHE